MSIELTNITEQPQVNTQPQTTAMPQMPVHPFQDPHATAGVPGYPYPPPQQYYPTPYMNQVLYNYNNSLLFDRFRGSNVNVNIIFFI